MKRFLLVLFVPLAMLAQGPPQCQKSETFSAPATGQTINAAIGCTGWRLTFTVTGFTAVQIELDGSQNNSTFAAFPSVVVLEGSNPFNWTGATTSNTIVVRAFAPYVRVRFVSASGSGSLTYTLLGYYGTSAAQDNGSGGGGGGATRISVYSQALVTLAGTSFFAPGGGSLPSGTETDVQTKAPTSYQVANFFVSLSAAPGAGNSIAFTWRKGGVSQSVTCTVTDPATTCSDLTHNFSGNQGDLLDVQAVVTGTVTATPIVLMTATL